MEVKSNRNPMRWLVYLTVFGLILGASRMHWDITRASNDYTLFGINVGRFGAINPLLPFYLILMITFLCLYIRQSKYAWHAITLPFISNYPISLILRMGGIYFQPYKHMWETVLWPVIWVLVLVYLIQLRNKYYDYLSSQKGKSCDSGERTG